MIENIMWKIKLVFQCLIMDFKNWRLEKRIEKERKKTEMLREELEQIVGEVEF